jgi:hypothetical protein
VAVSTAACWLYVNRMTTITITLSIVGLLYGIPASVRTFRREMADNGNVWLAVGCIGTTWEHPPNNPSSGKEPDQRQKDVCPPGEAGQSGHDEHILVAHEDLREQFRLPSNQRAAVRVSIAD